MYNDDVKRINVVRQTLSQLFGSFSWQRRYKSMLNSVLTLVLILLNLTEIVVTIRTFRNSDSVILFLSPVVIVPLIIWPDEDSDDNGVAETPPRFPPPDMITSSKEATSSPRTPYEENYSANRPPCSSHLPECNARQKNRRGHSRIHTSCSLFTRTKRTK